MDFSRHAGHRRGQSFDSAHAAWLQRHVDARTGERKDRLRRGHAHGEILFLRAVWWPLFGHFDDLHPEYEVKDWRGAACYLDFAWFAEGVRFNIDVKGFGPHVQQMDRSGYRREAMREMFLHSHGFRTLTVAYDSLKEEPNQVRDLIAQIARSGSDFSVGIKGDGAGEGMNRVDAALLSYARAHGGDIYPFKAAEAIGVHRRTAAIHLKRLAEKGLFESVAAGGKVCRYRLRPDLA
ncbi:hypothetical protein ACTHPH_14015 [Paenibacillus pasadenensis]|uniref:hypothetical protein n=1 Tax=Paenibacillus pasadenensis TaxID=217090 RepID=UPI0004036FA7|nr:hypothetical protein [Paenibacillus pasadenensis]